MKKYLLPLILILLITFALIGNCAWLSGYDQRIKLTIDNTKIDAALSDFPVTIFFTSTQGEEIFTEFDADSDYMKCAFTASDGTTQLYAEKELFDDSAQKAIYHVKVPSVASGADTDIYYYYNNDHADNTTYIGAINTTAGDHVWDSNFKAVYHMVDATTSTVVDSTSNNNDGTKKAANEPIEAPGKVGQGQDFEPTDDYISGGDVLEATTNFTAEAIFKFDNTVTENRCLVGKRESAGNYDGWQIRLNDDTSLYGFCTYSGDNINRIATVSSIGTTFHYATISVINLVGQLYLDGSAVGTTSTATGTVTATNANSSIGSINNALHIMDGVLDEVRISYVARSAAWIKATYNSLWDSLLTYGSEETEGVTINVMFMFSNF